MSILEFLFNPQELNPSIIELILIGSELLGFFLVALGRAGQALAECLWPRLLEGRQRRHVVFLLGKIGSGGSWVNVVSLDSVVTVLVRAEVVAGMRVVVAVMSGAAVGLLTTTCAPITCVVVACATITAASSAAFGWFTASSPIFKGVHHVDIIGGGSRPCTGDCLLEGAC